MKVYLAGKILKGDEIGRNEDWRVEYIDALMSTGVEILSPNDPSLDESDPMQIFGHDCFFVREADVIIVNAAEKLGAGTAQEMVIAKMYNKLVISVVPQNSHYHRTNLFMECGIVENWVHPFVFAFSDSIVDSIHALSKLLCDFDIEKANIKGIDIVDESINYYLKSKEK